MATYKLIDIEFKNKIRDVIIPSLFKSLNKSDINILTKYLIRLLNCIILFFNFKDYDDYTHQLKQNDYLDIKWLVLQLLPYTENNDKIKSLNDMVLAKEKNININKEEPQYIHSNFQYGRCIRNNDNYIEINFDEKYIEHNFYLLIDSLKDMSNKLHVNWIDIYPITLYEYQEDDIYLDLKDKFENYALEDIDVYTDCSINLSEEDSFNNIMNKWSGIYIGDIYNTIVNDLYDSVKGVKWLLYDFKYRKNNLMKFYPMIYILEDMFTLNNCDPVYENYSIMNLLLNNVDYFDLSEKCKYMLNNRWKELINSVKNGDSITNEQKIEIMSASNLNIMARGIIYSFDKNKYLNYKAQEDEYNKYIPLSDTTNNDSDDEEDTPNEILNKSLESLDFKYFYEFMSISVNIIRYTYYGDVLIDYSDGKYELKPLLNIDRTTHTSKNLYNFAKSLCHYGNSFDPYPKHWKSLDIDQKNEILRRLNLNVTTDKNDWFLI